MGDIWRQREKERETERLIHIYMYMYFLIHIQLPLNGLCGGYVAARCKQAKTVTPFTDRLSYGL